MPNRTILNKYGLFVSLVHKVLKKKKLSEDDAAVIRKARLVAALSSNHSWKTSRYLQGDSGFDKDAIEDEIRGAFSDGWKEINENDVKEVVNSEVDEHALSLVLLYALDKSSRKEYSELLPQIKEEFADGMEPIENIQT